MQLLVASRLLKVEQGDESLFRLQEMQLHMGPWHHHHPCELLISVCVPCGL
jgi:hypothetical protein